MKRRTLAGCLLLFAAIPAVNAAVYRSVDANGNPVFTDQPQPESSRINVAPPDVVDVDAKSSQPQKKALDPAEPQQAFIPYTQLAIVSPRNEATIPTGAAGDVQVELAITPQLAPGDKVRLRVDGQVSQSALRTSAFFISGMNRGEHTLRVELLDSTGHVRQQSDPVTIYVQRASQNMPANPRSSSSAP
ncbi:DUF4124 domain-containing protein [Phytohalomonas tamaricis]|uniref:DUF4124 domain-containing protein n=1 Tax=Phytohalomonas tamaricis TaxID=2081032 RepID=UPI000D0B8ECA|nr:DUF4124 domain-containing protein [Phytohalomonas tamaricis]